MRSPASQPGKPGSASQTSILKPIIDPRPGPFSSAPPKLARYPPASHRHTTRDTLNTPLASLPTRVTAHSRHCHFSHSSLAITAPRSTPPDRTARASTADPERRAAPWPTLASEINDLQTTLDVCRTVDGQTAFNPISVAAILSQVKMNLVIFVTSKRPRDLHLGALQYSCVRRMKRRGDRGRNLLCGAMFARVAA